MQTLIFAVDLKQIAIYLVTFLVFLQPFSKTWLLVSFKVNQDYIAKNLCENRAKPVLHCDGKCVLMKRMKQAEQAEQKQAPANHKEKAEVLYCAARLSFAFLKPAAFCENQVPSTYDADFYLSSSPADVFHPPQFNLM